MSEISATPDSFEVTERYAEKWDSDLKKDNRVGKMQGELNDFEAAQNQIEKERAAATQENNSAKIEELNADEARIKQEEDFYKTAEKNKQVRQDTYGTYLLSPDIQAITKVNQAANDFYTVTQLAGKTGNARTELSTADVASARSKINQELSTATDDRKPILEKQDQSLKNVEAYLAAHPLPEGQTLKVAEYTNGQLKTAP